MLTVLTWGPALGSLGVIPSLEARDAAHQPQMWGTFLDTLIYKMGLKLALLFLPGCGGYSVQERLPGVSPLLQLAQHGLLQNEPFLCPRHSWPVRAPSSRSREQQMRSQPPGRGFTLFPRRGQRLQ